MNVKDEKITILMVEDDLGHARLIEKNLRRAGISNPMIHFDDGKHILEYFFGTNARPSDHIAQPMLILLDLNLPEVDGYEVLRTIKKHPATQAIPVIILTTTDNPAEIAKCYELGCNVYITKPVEYESFSDAIRKLGLMLAVIKVPGEN